MSAKNGSKAAEVNAETMPEVKTTDPVCGTKPEKRASLMYIGPTIAGVVRHSTVYKAGALPQKAQECVEEFPMMAKLFVELGKMPDAVKELNRKQSALSAIYAQVEARFNAKKI